MLRALSIRDVVLIERLELDFAVGLTVLTGETGAGKSILLDSLGLVLGGRSDAHLIRDGASQATVTAVFDVPGEHPAMTLLLEQSMDQASDIVLRRTVTSDGRSRAFVNDQAVSVGFLREVGSRLVEIQGQFDQRGLLDPSSHRAILDSFADLRPLALEVGQAWEAYQAARRALTTARAEAERAQADEVWLRHSLEEFDRFGIEPDEEDHLAASRTLYMNAEKLIASIQSALHEVEGDAGAGESLSRAIRNLTRIAKPTTDKLDEVVAAFERAGEEIAEASSLLHRLLQELDMDPKRQAQIDERLFALRDLARKHKVGSKDLSRVREDLANRLGQLDQNTAIISDLNKEVAATSSVYEKGATQLSLKRKEAAQVLDEAIVDELAPLKMEKAQFKTVVEKVPEAEWGATGIDRIRFEVSTNPGQPFGPLNKIASGGELSRFLLALKVALKKADPVPTLVFDEVDAGIGGATADAVGERLQRLSQNVQILAVTHSPQVSARANDHWVIRKETHNNRTVTGANRLASTERQEEIARMLSGATITREAQAAAARLLGHDASPRRRQSKG